MNKLMISLGLLLVAQAFALADGTNSVASFEYRMPNGTTNLYLVQAPTNPAPDAPLLIYMHGAGGNETQGMTLFPVLRQVLAAKGWIYISPRFYEYNGLMADISSRYGKRKVYLAGASAGAGISYNEIRKKPKAYAGQFLIGPALPMEKPALGLITTPTFIIYGDKDGRNTSAAALIAAELKLQKAPVLEIVIKGEGHEAPYGKQDWWYEALAFVTGIPFKPE